MREKSFDPRAVDLPGLARRGGTLEGRAALAALHRLGSALAAQPDGDAEWSAHAWLLTAAGALPQTWLHLQASARVPLQCQRCLQLLVEPLEVDRRLRFVAGEAEAARLDEDSEDDVLTLQPRLNLLELIEDELILALPLVPRHAVCPQPLRVPADTASDAEVPAPNPFAALAALRRRNPPEDA